MQNQIKSSRKMTKLLQYLPKLQISFALLLLSISWANASPSSHPDPETAFLDCLSFSDDGTISSIVYTPKNPAFSSVLDSYIRNFRYLSPENPKPKAILTPVTESQVQLAITCGKSSGLQVRVRSGGHDFAGSSYISDVPFFILDLFNFRSVSVDAESQTAWVGAGATLGELYYYVYQANHSLGFTAGYWPTVGAGGHISGGGYGALTRQYGLAADHVIDAALVDANGKIHDRKSMGEDLFWAIRGGIGSNFAVILSYKLSLVEVPEYVTSFSIVKTLDQNTVKLVHKWQYVSPKLPIDLTLSVLYRSAISNETGNPTLEVTFISVYRGGVDELLSIMGKHFPELGLTRNDCHEMLWIQYFPFHMGLPLDNVKEILTTRDALAEQYFTGKADFVREPIPEDGIEKILRKFLEVPPQFGQMEWTIFGGGIMDKIPETEIPFPHRGNLFIMFQGIIWNQSTTPREVQTYIDWIRELHHIVGKYVPNNPRAAYADYRDLDLGVNNVVGETSIEQARKWGEPYFKNNFDRLVQVKTQVDPENYFKNEQSFPPHPAYSS